MPHRRSPRPPAGGMRGFTLIEVLTALAVFSILAVVLFGSLYTTVNMPDDVQHIQARYLQVHNALDRMAREVATAYLSRHTVATNPEAWKTLFKLKDSFGRDRLDFTAFAHLKLTENANESDQTELSYFVEDSKEVSGELNIMRREAKRIDHEPEKGGVVYPILEGIKSFEVTVYDPQMKEWKAEWDTSKIEQLTKLPPYVRFVVEMVDPYGVTQKFVTTAEIMLPEPLDFGRGAGQIRPESANPDGTPQGSDVVPITNAPRLISPKLNAVTPTQP